ncbi:hypothetical protein [Haloferula sp.]|uniref:hypothetical protein n=1 Tax=Haloferula sp. TaxID=2497595 RepID=UPI00329F60EF
MKRNIPRILTVIAILLAVWFFSKRSGSSNEQASSEMKESDGASQVSGAEGEVSRVSPESPKADEKQVRKRIIDTLHALKGGTVEPDEARRLLKELRDFLGTLPPEMAAAVITEVLGNPTLDSATGLDFVVGDNGFLADPSSLRVALLDWLAQFDLKQAGVVAAQVLASPTQSDEWAVSLRNFARANPTSGSFDFLRSKAEELIRNPDWKVDPTIGYFEAFDVLVYTKATESSELLSELVSDRTPEGRPYAHASYLTLDRLVIKEPVAMMKEFFERKDLTDSRGKMVANMFARADLREQEQRQLVQQYLLDPTRTHEELSSFAGVYPNNNYSVSKNLLTGNDSRTHDQLATHDRAALEIVTSWLNDPAFEAVRPHVATMHRRLVTFVGQANQ